MKKNAIIFFLILLCTLPVYAQQKTVSVTNVGKNDDTTDTDGDSVPDSRDKCPYVAGSADNQGCPPSDRDHDGVNDAIDKCPDVPGPISNNGCPIIENEVIGLVGKAARYVYFNTGKATLKPASYVSLDKIVRVMKDDPSLFIDITGYTDNVGKPEMNEELSDKRANTCRNYILSKGIAADRLTAKGYGESNPVTGNKTALGRAQNRRTEFKLRNYK
ncbi:MAG: OmpA family protein [Taibaiella sp.]|nr:OmpA family protein [Taibaiella sp.]